MKHDLESNRIHVACASNSSFLAPHLISNHEKGSVSMQTGPFPAYPMEATTPVPSPMLCISEQTSKPKTKEHPPQHPSNLAAQQEYHPHHQPRRPRRKDSPSPESSFSQPSPHAYFPAIVVEQLRHAS